MGGTGARMGSKAAIRARARALGRYDERQALRSERQSDDLVFASLSSLYAMLPPDVRARDLDPERVGVRRMHAALAVLGRKR